MSKATYEAAVWSNPWHFIAFSCGLGVLPVAPGTWGTLGGVLFYLLIHNYSLLTYLVWVLAATVFGIWLCDKVAKDIGVHDYGGIVWDEVAGYLVTMIAAPQGWGWIIIGFILFRIFDILKPWPISYLDQHVKGGFGIMIDDLAAAVPAWLILQLLAKLL